MLSTVEVAGKRAGDATFLGQPKGSFLSRLYRGMGTVVLLWNADRVHVNVQLIKAASDAHLWAEAFGFRSRSSFRGRSRLPRKESSLSRKSHLTNRSRGAAGVTFTKVGGLLLHPTIKAGPIKWVAVK